MEQTKIYTTILHDPSEGHTVRYVQLPFGMAAAKACAEELVDELLLGTSLASRVVAIIPGRHVVGLGGDNNRPCPDQDIVIL